MASIEAYQGETRLGELRLLPPTRYDRHVARHAGMLAHQLMFGSGELEAARVDGTPVGLAVVTGNGSHFDMSQVYGVTLEQAKPGSGFDHVVGFASHSMMGRGQVSGCSELYCGTAWSVVELSSAIQSPSQGKQGETIATPHLRDGYGWQLEREMDAALDGISDSGGLDAPQDPRRDPLAMEILSYMRRLGHVFVHPLLERYAVELVGPVPETIA